MDSIQFASVKKAGDYLARKQKKGGDRLNNILLIAAIGVLMFNLILLLLVKTC